MRTAILLVSIVTTAGCATTQAASTTGTPNTEVLPASDVAWEHLNPARGDKGPRAATLWGDRNGNGPTGFLVRFVDGFSSPPHIHNVSYRGVVIHGLVHNNDPDAEPVWMPPGSYWTQPRGGVHITAARGGDTVAYIEIDEGPYLVRPVEQAFDAGEEPVNIDASRIAWTAAPGAGGFELAPLWGNATDETPSGVFVKLPPGASGVLRGQGARLRAVVVRGRTGHRAAGHARTTTLEPGGYFGSTGPSTHRITCAAHQACVIYVRAQGEVQVTPAD